MLKGSLDDVSQLHNGWIAAEAEKHQQSFNEAWNRFMSL